MILKSFRVMNFRCVDDSDVIPIDDITCLVGKNESGKTTLIQALAKINPANDYIPADFEVDLDYPRKRLNPYKRTHANSPAPAIIVEFALEDAEKKKLEEEFGNDVIISETIKITKYYNNSLSWEFETNDQHYINKLILDFDLDQTSKTLLSQCITIQDAASTLDALILKNTPIPTDLSEPQQPAQPNAELGKLINCKSIITGISIAPLRDHIVNKTLINCLPKLFYYDSYSVLPGNIDLNLLKSKKASPKKSDEELTSFALIDLVGADIDEFLEQKNYERLKADLEAASNIITDKMLEYWTQNQNLEVEFDLKDEHDNNQKLTCTRLYIRIRNTRHKVTVSFDKRSRGFIWFFSFLVAFSNFEYEGSNVILLLDEPGLNLHAKAQADFLNFIKHQLAPNHQIIYTTHSPFMIDSTEFRKIRTVHDDIKRGTIVSDTSLIKDNDTVFPLQAALGYDVAQSLFIGKNNLLVEGVSDLIYLQIASEVLKNEGRESLNDNWAIVPVGGATNICTFVSLIGAHNLNLVVFFDADKRNSQKVENLIKNKILSSKQFISVGQFISTNEADIEDLFTNNNYIELVNTALASDLSVKIENNALNKKIPRIIKQIEKHFIDNLINNGKFNHYKPALYLSSNASMINKVFDNDTKNNFEAVFKDINNLLK